MIVIGPRSEIFADIRNLRSETNRGRKASFEDENDPL
jgi:hypothetical protein